MTATSNDGRAGPRAPAFVTLVRVFGSYLNTRITVVMTLVFTVGFTVLITIGHALDPPIAGYDLDISVAASFLLVGLSAVVPFTCFYGVFVQLTAHRAGGSLAYAWKLDVPPWKVPTAVWVSTLRTIMPLAVLAVATPALAIGGSASLLAGAVASTVLGVLLWSAFGLALMLTVKRSMLLSYAFVLFDTWVFNIVLFETPFYHLSLVRHTAAPFFSLITVSGSPEFEPGPVPDVTPLALAVPVVVAATVVALLAATWRVTHLMRTTTAGAT